MMNNQSHNYHLKQVHNMIVQDRQQLEDMYVVEKDIGVVVYKPKSAIRQPRSSYPDCLHDLMVTSIAVLAGNRIMYPTSHAWAQIINKLGVPKNYFKKLLRTNIPLLVENLNHCFQVSENNNFRRLLRMRNLQLENRTVAVLRAYLDDTHNRLDNIYVIEALIKLLAEHNYDIGTCRFDGNGLWLQIKLDEKLKLKLNELFAKGVDIANSEIGLTKGMELRALLTRLICTNGMTVDEKGKTIHLEPDYFLREHIPFNDIPHMPPATLPEHVQNQINVAVKKAVEIIFSQHGDVLNYLDQQVENMSNLRMPLSNSNQLRTAVSDVLQQSGIRYWGGVEIDRIEESYRSGAGNEGLANAWGIINAITHYATHDIFMPAGKSGRHRNRNVEQLDILLGDVLSYGHRMDLQNNAQMDKKAVSAAFAVAFKRTGEFLAGSHDPDLRGEMFLGERISLSQRLQRSAFRLMQPRTVKWDRVQSRISQLDNPNIPIEPVINVPIIRSDYPK